ncbi:hypothetical protein [Brucella sp. IR073]|uniref:hypothetical protein n=1 Tax=unclassified Brucella TaxID=2632610 RepID=UPI003B985567
MNILDDRGLARRFRDNSVPSKERFRYFLVVSVLAIILANPAILAVAPHSVPIGWDYLSLLSDTIINVVGISVCYKTNKSGDDKEFIERMVCIGFPTIIKLSIIFIIVTLLYFIIGDIVDTNETLMSYPLIGFIAVAIFEGWFYLRLNGSIRIAAY